MNKQVNYERKYENMYLSKYSYEVEKALLMRRLVIKSEEKEIFKQIKALDKVYKQKLIDRGLLNEVIRL